MNGLRCIFAFAAVLPVAVANSHREAPTTLDAGASITDFYAFRGNDDASKATFILHVDGAFDPAVVYAIRAGRWSYEFRFGAAHTYSVATPDRVLAPALARDKV